MTSINKGVTSSAPTAYEYFIPDYANGKIFYLIVEKNYARQPFTETGTINSDKLNSFTVSTYYPNKPDAKRVEYTVTKENGKWHQVANSYDINGKLVLTQSLDMRRLLGIIGQLTNPISMLCVIAYNIK